MEALIDLRCAIEPPATLGALAAVQEAEGERYPDRRDRMRFEGQLTLGSQVGAAASQRHVGYLFTSADGRQAFQARTDGFTFSRFRPYERWETFRDEARRLWDAYRERVAVAGVTRVAVRFINRFDLPLPLNDFKDYFETVPEVAPNLPQALSGFLMRLEIPQEDLDAMLLLTQALMPPEQEDVASILLDIDLFREYEQPVDGDEAWRFLERLRVRKNDVFEACITERAREVIR